MVGGVETRLAASLSRSSFRSEGEDPGGNLELSSGSVGSIRNVLICTIFKHIC